jgi:predicted enzyme related to lactoylglutathione lyase
MKLGAFSVSLNVSDLEASKAFYETLGFSVFGGALEKKYLIMKNAQTLIGLFEGMFENNILTFNPGWDQQAQALSEYEDVRQIHAAVMASGTPILSESLEETSGPGSFVIQDPDGNTILIDQHV